MASDCEQCRKCFWDSGKIESDQSVLVPYAGQALTREQEYQVSLEIWDNYGNRAKAETAFTTGILIPEIFRLR